MHNRPTNSLPIPSCQDVTFQHSLANLTKRYSIYTLIIFKNYLPVHFGNYLWIQFWQLLEGDCFPCVDPERCSNMGYYADKSYGRGIMYLATREEEPFCGKQKCSHSTPKWQSSRAFSHQLQTAFLLCSVSTANQYRVQLHSATTLQPVTTQGKIELVLIGANNFTETFTLTK